jgi:hypothetical protein
VAALNGAFFVQGVQLTDDRDVPFVPPVLDIFFLELQRVPDDSGAVSSFGIVSFSEECEASNPPTGFARVILAMPLFSMANHTFRTHVLN